MSVTVYLDENVDRRVATGLRRRGVEVITVEEAGLKGASDDRHLAEARQRQAILFTHDADFLRLAKACLQRGEEFPPIAFCHKEKYRPGRLISLLKGLVETIPGERHLGFVYFL